MFTPDLDLKVVTRCTKFSIQDKTGVETAGDGVLWGATGSTGLNPVDLSEVVIRVISPSGVSTDFDVTDEVPVPVTGEWWFNDLTGSGEDGLHNLVYRLKLTDTTDITVFADYNSTVVGTVLVTAASHGLVTGMYAIIDGTTNYDGEYYVTRVSDNTFYITKTFVEDDATGTVQGMYQSTFYPYVYCAAEAGVEKMYANISRMVKGSTRDSYLESARTAYGLLGSLKSAISSANTTALTVILAEINQILDFYDVEPNL